MDANLERLRSIKTFPSLVKYLRDDLDWPIEPADVEDLTFEYEAEELGLDARTAAKIKEVKQLRPFVTGQPWGIFFINFEPKQLPIVALRRILSKLVLKKRASGNKSQQASWQLNDLLFISSYGDSDERAISFAHFSEDKQFGDLPTLRVLGWDSQDTVLRLEDVEQTLSTKLRWPEDENNVDDWRKAWSSAFTLRHREVVKTSKELAVKLADLAIVIRRRANKVLSIESDKGPMRQLYKAFQEALIHDLDEDDFADMYAQTIAYGLLTARVSRPSGLVVEDVTGMVPITNPFLKELLQTFLTVGGRKGKIDFDELGINEVVELLRIANMEAVLKDFGDRNPLEDPVIHFYELFLKEYDPEKRMSRGVFYTPRPVVGFIVRSVDETLRTEFGLEDGLADMTTWGEMAKSHQELRIPDGVKLDEPFVQILDPATGTGTFLVEVIDVIHRTMLGKWKKQGRADREIYDLWNEYVPRHLLPRVHGFELMMAPYAIAHMKIGLKLRETHYSFFSSERARIYLTNTLEEPKDFSSYLEQMAPALAHEAEAANKIKSATAVTVVIGNPPYSGHSSNNQVAWIVDKVHDYKRGLPDLQKPGQAKWLQDDYVKFLRYGQWRIERTGTGVLGYITNHSFLDNPTFRGMRKSLLTSFSDLHVMDLHGNSKKRETCPDGSKDENVFDIQQGVAISIMVKGSQDGIRISHKHLYGLREDKYKNLLQGTLGNIDWQELSPAASFYFFVPQDIKRRSEYERNISLPNLLNQSGDPAPGIVTTQDEFAISFTRQEALQKVIDLLETKSEAEARQLFRLCSQSQWNYERAKKQLNNGDWKHEVRKILYRPFDIRWTVYDSNVAVHRRDRVMKHMLSEKNIALVTARSNKSEHPDHFFSSRLMTETKCGESTVQSYLLPLYILQSDGTKQQSIRFESSRKSNLDSEMMGSFGSRLDLLFNTECASVQVGEFCPEDMFHYMYAVFYAPTYRARYAEFLKTDFPRLPLTSDAKLFSRLSALGADLIALHLLEADYQRASWNASMDKGGRVRPESKSPLARLITQFKGTGPAEVAKGHPKYKDRKISINPSHYFEGVTEEVWNFHIGGYQVCEKWLKSRRGRTLTEEDINHYQHVVVAINETIRLMAEIDRVIEGHGGWPLVGSQDAPKTESSGGLPFA